MPDSPISPLLPRTLYDNDDYMSDDTEDDTDDDRNDLWSVTTDPIHKKIFEQIDNCTELAREIRADTYGVKTDLSSLKRKHEEECRVLTQQLAERDLQIVSLKREKAANAKRFDDVHDKLVTQQNTAKTLRDKIRVAARLLCAGKNALEET